MPEFQIPEAAGVAALASEGLADHVRSIRLDLPEWLAAAMVACANGLERGAQRATGIGERQALAELGGVLRRRQRDWLHLLAQAVVQAVEGDARGDSEPGLPGSGRDPSDSGLALLDDGAIDTDIALSRLVQVAELKSEAALRELAARCSRLRGRAELDPDANPMRPTVVADALRRASTAFGLDDPARLLLLRELALAIGDQLAGVYARQLERLKQCRVAPAGYRRQAVPALPGARERSAAAGAAVAVRSVTADALRRLAAPAGPADAVPPDELMARLLALLLRRSSLTDGARQLIRRLDVPARRLAVSEPDLWQTPEHPLWQLLDRLASAGAVFGDEDFTRVGSPGAALDQAVTQLEQDQPPAPGLLDEALTAMDGATTDLLGLQASIVAPQAEAMQARLAREDIERRVREQLVEQARPARVPAALRQFLVGPWALALAHSAHAHGFDSARFREQADAVEDMLALGGRTRSQPAAAGAFTRCITHARLGLMDAGLPEARIDVELVDLENVLRRPWPSGPQQEVDWDENGNTRPAALAPSAAAPDSAPDSALETALETVPAAAEALRDDAAHSGMSLHEMLPTVPIDLDRGSEGPSAGAMAARWVDALEPGQLCRLSLQGRWNNVQLVWRSLDRGMFVFSGRGVLKHTLPRGALLKLRGAGLAASIERGQFIAQALGELAGVAD